MVGLRPAIRSPLLRETSDPMHGVQVIKQAKKPHKCRDFYAFQTINRPIERLE